MKKIRKRIAENVVKSAYGDIKCYYTISSSEMIQIIKNKFNDIPVRVLYDFVNKVYIFGDANTTIHYDLIENMKLYAHTEYSWRYPIIDTEIYKYMDKNCAMFKIINTDDYRSYTRYDGYRMGVIGKIDKNMYVILRDNTEAIERSKINGNFVPDELAKCKKVPMLSGVKFVNYDIRGTTLTSKEQLPQKLINESNELNYEGETINIDGIEKTVYNSNGDRIAMSEPALRNFYKWFGDSKVVDEQGRPLVVYHGSPYSKVWNKNYLDNMNKVIFKMYQYKGIQQKYEPITIDKIHGWDEIIHEFLQQNPNFKLSKEELRGIEQFIDFDTFDLTKRGLNTDSDVNSGFFFTDNKEDAETFEYHISSDGYGKKDKIDYFSTAGTRAFYLSLQKPYIGKNISNKNLKKYEDMGYNGIINVMNNMARMGRKIKKEYVAFYPNQIKSVDNNGDWSLNSDNINEGLGQSLNYGILYHGTNDNFDEFSKDYQDGGYLGNGFYFTMSKSMARHYGKNIISAKLKYNSSFFFDSDVLDEKSIIKMLSTIPNLDKNTLNTIKAIYLKQIKDNAVYDANKNLFSYIDFYNGDSTKILKELGYDSIDNIDRDSKFVVFEPNQIEMIKDDEHLYEAVKYVDGIEVLVNPTNKELTQLLRESKEKELRIIYNIPTNNFYAWDSSIGVHSEISTQLNIGWNPKKNYYLVYDNSGFHMRPRGEYEFLISDYKEYKKMVSEIENIPAFQQYMAKKSLMDNFKSDIKEYLKYFPKILDMEKTINKQNYKEIINDLKISKADETYIHTNKKCINESLTVEDKTKTQALIDGMWYHKSIIDKSLGIGSFEKLKIGDKIEWGSDSKKSIWDISKKYFGITKDINECGYILPDGSMLDFSGKKFGRDGGYRNFDHREISSIDEETLDMNKFIDSGAIRVQPEKEQIAILLSKFPTDEQTSTLTEIINIYGFILVEMVRSMKYWGNNNHTYFKKYDNARKMIKDMKNFFDNKLMKESASFGGANWQNNMNALGNVPATIDCHLFMTMFPYHFLSLCPKYNYGDDKFFDDYIESRQPIGIPFLTVDFDFDKKKMYVVGHEGRHRVSAIYRRHNGNIVDVPVAILYSKNRYPSIPSIETLRKEWTIVSEKGDKEYNVGQFSLYHELPKSNDKWFNLYNEK